MAVPVPGQRRDPVAGRHPQTLQREGQLDRAGTGLGPALSVQVTLDPTRHDPRFGKALGGEIQKPALQQRAVHHQTVHDVSSIMAP